MTVEANLYYEDGDLAEAAALSKRSLAILRHSYRDESPLVAGALANLGEIQRLSGDFEAAGHSIVEAQNLYRRLQGDAHPNVIRLEANNGTLAL